MKKSLVTELKSPSSAYRGKPFWAWNGVLEPDELRRQIRIMKQMGMGGFFMHSRVGLGTAYLSNDWFNCVNACIDEAETLDMEAWLYDEDRWPSGAAGGLVTKNPAYQMRYLEVEILDSVKTLKGRPKPLAAFAARIDGSVATGSRRISTLASAKLAAGESLVLFTEKTDEPSEWYNGYTYLDTLNEDAVRQFIKVTHEAYLKKTGQHFGKRVPGIFTDEPNHNGMLSGKVLRLPWTSRLPRVFKSRYGYDLIPELLSLAFDVDGVEICRSRYDYHECLAFLFADAFGRLIGEWCEKNNLLYTGHLLEESSLSRQTNEVTDCMRFYEYMQAPGIDVLCENNMEYDTAKQVSSVANQFNRKWRLSETYGCTGWDFSFEGHKAISDWQVALGINLRCQHLSWYTMEGQAKRDYPAGIFYQSPWWEQYSKVEDYFARAHVLMSQGREVRDLLVIHPVESMWFKVKKDWRASDDTKRLDESIAHVRNELLREHIDFDYGNEEILSKHASVTKRGFIVKQAAYQAIVVPPMLTMRSTTLALIARFRAQGGTVVFAGEPAGFVDATPSNAVRELAARCVQVSDLKDLPAAVEPDARRLSIADPRGKEIRPALYCLREDSDNFYLFIANTSINEKDAECWTAPFVAMRREEFPSVVVSGLKDAKGQPLSVDLETGDIHLADATRGSDGWRIETSLPRIGSRMFIFPKKKETIKAPVQKRYETVRSESLPKKGWDYALSEPNCLPLDRASYRIGKTGSFKPDADILKIDYAVRDALGIKRRGGAMVQPWARIVSKTPKSVPVSLKYNINVEDAPSGALQLALERPETFDICLNGHPVSQETECGWWTDRSMKTIALDPNLFRKGANELRLDCKYDETHPGLEMIYVLGGFGVAVKGADVKMVSRPDALAVGDWTVQGLAFFGGSLTYRKTVSARVGKNERLFVKIPSYAGVGVRVLIDGQPVGIIAWEPNEIDVTDAVRGKSFELRLELLGHRRNSHGPLHHTNRQLIWTGPSEFVSTDDRWTDAYQLVKTGLTDAPRLVYKRAVH